MASRDILPLEALFYVIQIVVGLSTPVYAEQPVRTADERQTYKRPVRSGLLGSTPCFAVERRPINPIIEGRAAVDAIQQVPIASDGY